MVPTETDLNTRDTDRVIPRVFLTGRRSSRLYEFVNHELTATIPSWQVERHDFEISSILERLTSDYFDLILVVQEWPDEFELESITELSAHSVLSRLVVAFGPWCWSDGRTRALWPIGARFPAIQIARAISINRKQIENEGYLTPFPFTASRDEAYAQQHPASSLYSKTSSPRRFVQVLSNDRGLAELWSAFVIQTGHYLYSAESGDAPDTVLFDIDPWLDHFDGTNPLLSIDLPLDRIIAFTGSDDPDVIHKIRKTGPVTVLSKLAGLAILLEVLESPTRNEGDLQSSQDGSPFA